jgi:eukaryotic-like serine/threonine-protein kinase
VDECFGTETLVDLVEGRSDAALRARIEGHASRCEHCRRLLSSLARGSAPTEPVERPAALATPPQVGRYVIERVLGAGGMGIVYAALDPELKRTVAVKLLRGGMQERLRREAQTLAQLAHPNVVAVFDVGEHDGRLFIAMEHVPGETLADWQGASRSHAELLDAYLAAGRGLAAAHDLGIVHRDFKPENVLVGSDGRVRVADFGLAREQAGEQGGPALASSALAGTPYYMAPEVYAGGTADARSDQFAFCVALFTALTGERPFGGDSFDELRAAVTAGTVREPKHRLPGRIAGALRRGLATDPAARFPDMDALLAALAPRPRRWPWVAVPATATAIAVTALVATRGGAGASPCGGAAEALRGVWDPERKVAVLAALTGTGVPYADATRRETERLLDRYAADWQAMHTDACQATRVRKEDSEDVLDLRMTCLADRRRAFAGVVGALATADRTVAEHAVAAAAALPALAPCADVSALRTLVRPPNQAAQAQVAELRGELARLRAQRDTGAGGYPALLARARPVLSTAHSIGYRPLEAEALALVALLERDTEDYPAARASYEQAVLAADAGRDDRATADALIVLIRLVGKGLGKPDEVPPLRARAQAVLERIDHPPELEGALQYAVGSVESATGDVAAADRDLTGALLALERVYGKDDVRIVEPLLALAALELARERPAPARAQLERVLAIQTRALGGQHPDVARTLSMEGGAAFSARAYDEAVALHQRALTIVERTVGRDSLAAANVLSNLADVYDARGESARSVDAHRRAIAIAEAKLGPTHQVTLSYREALATALASSGHHTEAIALLEDVLAAQRKQLGPHPDTATTLEALAFIELGVKHFAAARDHAAEARTMFERVLGDGYNPHVELAITGEALYGLGERAGACDAFEAARRAGEGMDDPGAAAWLDAQLGRALVETNRDPNRGRALVLAAYPTIAADPRLVEQRAELVAWMKRRGIRVPG